MIDMAPITLFFGTNSSGKSSIGQFLMILKQTIEEHSQEAVFYLGGENSVGQLNSYEEMVFQNDLKNNNIIFEYQWSLNYASDDFKILVSPYTAPSGNRLAFRAKVDSLDPDPSKIPSKIPSISEFKYELKLKEDGESQFSSGMKRKRGISHSGQKIWYYVVEATSILPFKLNRRSSNLSEDINKSPIKFHRFPRDVADIVYSNAEDFSTKFHSEHEKLFSSLFYLGPIRTNEPEYNYHGAPKSVGSDGGHTIGAIVAAKDRSYEIECFTETGKEGMPFEKFIALNLKNIGLIEDFEVRNLYQQRYEVAVQTKGSQTWVNLSNVGFGVSQVLPLLVQCFYAPEGSIILIDQPEVHLHPYAQSALADVMIDVIESKSGFGKGFKERNIQLIIETHSEHFLRRLQRRIAEDKLSEDKIAAYFSCINNKVPLARLSEKRNFPESQLAAFENAGILSANDLATRSIKELCEVPKIGPVIAEKWQKAAEEYVSKEKEKAQLERLEIDEYGNIQNWPENFFGDEMGDVLAQAEAGIEKRMQQNTRGLER